MSRDSILIIDDMDVNRMLLAEIFKNTYKVIEAENGKEALEILKKEYSHIVAMFLDLEMPVMNGFTFLDRISSMYEAEGIPIFVVTVDDTNDAQLRALDYGVADIIKKPFNPRIIIKRVKNAVTLAEYRERLEGMVEEQVNRLEEKERKISRMNEKLIETLSSVVEFRDVETGEHIQRIKDYTRIMCEAVLCLYPESGLNKHEIDLIVAASAMHDIGKIAIPDAILLKPGKLSNEEFEVIKTHTTKGADLLDHLDILAEEEYFNYCRNIVLYHHEKYDGKGYPKGLAGEDIPLEAQIVSIADIFDALVSKRIYKEAYSIQSAFDMIVNGECGQFSNRIMRCFKESYSLFEETAKRSHMKEAAKMGNAV